MRSSSLEVTGVKDPLNTGENAYRVTLSVTVAVDIAVEDRVPIVVRVPDELINLNVAATTILVNCPVSPPV